MNVSLNEEIKQLVNKSFKNNICKNIESLSSRMSIRE